MQAQIQPGKVRLGDLLTLSVDARPPQGVQVLPAALPKRLGTFEIVASTALPPQTGGPQEIQRFQILLQNFTTGQQVLPGVPFMFKGTDGKARMFQTAPFKVQVDLVPAGPKDHGDIRGIKGVLGPVGISPWWWLLLVFALLVGAICLWRERKKSTQGPPPPPPVPAYQLAAAKLQDLLAADLEIKEFYSQLSEIVREYIEKGFAIPALERTTGELLRDVRKKGNWNSDRMLQLKQLLEECDLVKFAKFRPDRDQALKAHALAVQFVEGTRESLNRKDESLMRS